MADELEFLGTVLLLHDGIVYKHQSTILKLIFHSEEISFIQLKVGKGEIKQKGVVFSSDLEKYCTQTLKESKKVGTFSGKSENTLVV